MCNTYSHSNKLFDNVEYILALLNSSIAMRASQRWDHFLLRMEKQFHDTLGVLKLGSDLLCCQSSRKLDVVLYWAKSYIIRRLSRVRPQISVFIIVK